MGDTTIEEKLNEIQKEVRGLKLDDSLLFLNHLLGVSRGHTSDPRLGAEIKNSRPPVLAHIVHFIAKQILQNASNLGIRTLDWQHFQFLSGLVIEIDDPISHDPNWNGADPSGFFERVFSQQIGPQNRRLIQKYGLALGLFRDVGAVEWPERYDLRADIEQALGLPIELFMEMGHVAFALRTAKHQENECIGTFTPMMFAEAFRQGLDYCVPEVWTPFLEKAACDRETFRDVCKREEYNVGNSLVLDKLHVDQKAVMFEQFGFNPLWRYPIINLGESRYLAVDPDLIVERVTFGLFYDLFERDRLKFVQRFSQSFEKFIGQLLGTVCPQDRLWSAAAWEQANGGNRIKGNKIGDWGYRGEMSNVLLECKSLRPSLHLRTYGAESSMKSLAQRIAEAVEQLTVHSQSISEGRWANIGLPSRPTTGVIVSYGKVYTANGSFMRKRVLEILSQKGMTPIQYVVLSIDELDSVIRLVESGYAFDELVRQISHGEGEFNPLHGFHDELSVCALSSFSMQKGSHFLEGTLRGQRDRAEH